MNNNMAYYSVIKQKLNQNAEAVCEKLSAPSNSTACKTTLSSNDLKAAI